MDGPRDTPPGALAPATFEPPVAADGGSPDLAQIHRVHDRYLIELVEGMNLCPFARRSREQGRVHRPVFDARGDHPTGEEAAAALARVLERAPDAEIVLLTFVPRPRHAFESVEPFEAFVRDMREAWQALEHPTRFYAVGFHPFPEPEKGRATTADSMVPLIRRAPDPVIQCVRAEVLDAVRAQARDQAQARLQREMETMDPGIRALLASSVQTDPELSSDIARHNFDSVGEGEGRRRFEDVIADLRRDRDRSYGG